MLRIIHPVGVCVTSALDQQTVDSVLAMVDGHPCLARRLQVFNRYFLNSCYYQRRLSKYSHKALHAGQDDDTLGRHDKMKKIAIFFSAEIRQQRNEKDQLAILKGASTMIFTLSENNPCAHIMPSVRWSWVISLPDTRSYRNAVLSVPGQLFWSHTHLTFEALFPMICCSEFVIGSSKGKSPTVRVNAFGILSSSHCLFQMMLYFDGKTNEKSIWLG